MAKAPLRLKSISELHRLRELPGPGHPLISVVNVADMKRLPETEPNSLVLDFYCIALKRNFNVRMKYGQQEYDFDEGIMTFIAPGQVFSIEVAGNEPLQHSGSILYIHPDFLWNTPLAAKIRQYAFFDYEVNEALFLSEKEEATIAGIMQHVAEELQARADRFSQDIVIAQIEVLLNYAERFYQRQFITRKITNHKILHRLEALLNEYFNSGALPMQGLPTVQYIAEALHISPGYLSSMLKTLTGQSTQQHIQEKLVELAKEKLSTTDMTVSEIAYELGFEHPQSFSKFFKLRTSTAPLTFRESFN